MPTMPERMAVMETSMQAVQSDVSEIKADVKELLAWKNSSSGADQQSELDRKRLVGIVSLISGAVALVIDLGLKVVGIKI